jgi:DnaJ like chaperone protein
MLVVDNQPDKLIARGVPREFVNIATERLAPRTDAYDAIVEERSS